MTGLTLADNELQRYANIIVESIKDFVENSKTDGAVVGLSGGIDSAVVIKLGKIALGNKIKALIMPEIGVTSQADIDHAVDFANELGIEYKIIEINSSLESIKKSYPTLKKLPNNSLANVNLAPRVRMIFNYIVTNMENHIVLGTGNKTELLLGYFTKHGDGGVDFLPVGDIYKTQIRQLAKHLDIPQSISDKPPSAGLWHGQTDEEELGASYETIDSILYSLYDCGRSESETAEQLNIDLDIVKRMRTIVNFNKHKSSTPEIVRLPKVC